VRRKTKLWALGDHENFVEGGKQAVLKIIRACHDDQTVAFTTVINAVIPPRASIYIGDNGAPPRITSTLMTLMPSTTVFAADQNGRSQPLS
jgi:hypothetical protein